MTRRQEYRLPEREKSKREFPYRERLLVSFNRNAAQKYIEVTITEKADRNKCVHNWIDENYPGQITSFNIVHVTELPD